MVKVTVDRFSRAVKIIPLLSLPTSLETAELMFQYIFRYYNIPEDILRDRGVLFISKVWKGFTEKLGVTVSLTSRYAQNSLGHSAAKLTPFQCVLGYQPPLFPWNPNITGIPAVDDWFKCSKQVWEKAHQSIEEATVTRKRFTDRHRSKAPAHKAGDRVWLSTMDLRGMARCKKLNARYIRPLKIIKQINPVSFHLKLPHNFKSNPTLHASLLKPVTPGPLQGP